ncbi:MAG: NAD/FAD-utilizing enzyme [bacterium]
MKRYYFISDDLADLRDVETELEGRGVTMPQIHVLTDDNSGAENHNLHEVPSIMQKDVVRSTMRAALMGLTLGIVVLAVAYFSGATASAGWLPFVFLAIVAFGFVTWEGGMWGIQEPNTRFDRFKQALGEGKHVLYVEVKGVQEDALKDIAGKHPRLESAGCESASTDILIGVENAAMRFAKWGP